jgi:DNA invertase Pin-like site-specific DNA recombinase
MAKGQKRAAALYVRVSTDKQTIQNQIAALTAIAEARGWEVVQVYQDAGVSGAKGRKDRPGLDSMLRDASRRKFDVAMVWAIDRLGRSLIDLLDTIQTLEACGVDLYLDQQSLDTTTPAGKLMFQVCGAFGEFERSIIRQRVIAGMRQAKLNGPRPGKKAIGRPLNDPAAIDVARAELARGTGILKVAKMVGLGTGTVQRLKAGMRAEI